MFPLQIINKLRQSKNSKIKQFLDKNKTRNTFIYSKQWNAYWRENRRGYTCNISDAGIYTFEEAFNSTRHCGNEKQIFYEFLNKDKSP